jgi:hypothetical protein
MRIERHLLMPWLRIVATIIVMHTPSHPAPPKKNVPFNALPGCAQHLLLRVQFVGYR